VKGYIRVKVWSWKSLNGIKNHNNESWWWKDLRKSCNSREETWFDNNVQWKIGSGTKINGLMICHSCIHTLDYTPT